MNRIIVSTIIANASNANSDWFWFESDQPRVVGL